MKSFRATDAEEMPAAKKSRAKFWRCPACDWLNKRRWLYCRGRNGVCHLSVAEMNDPAAIVRAKENRR